MKLSVQSLRSRKRKAFVVGIGSLLQVQPPEDYSARAKAIYPDNTDVDALRSDAERVREDVSKAVQQLTWPKKTKTNRKRKAAL